MSGDKARKEIRFQGAGVSPGIAEAAIHVVRDDLEDVARYRIEPAQIANEIGRFEAALIQTRTQILEMQQKIAESIGAKDAGIFDAHLLVVEDRTLIDEVLRTLETGQHVLLDGTSGLLIVDPTPETLARYAEVESKRVRIAKQLTELRETKSTTRDGRHIVLSANIELPDDVDAVAANGAEGIGLYRTEFLYLNRTTLPTEDEQYGTYRKVAERVSPDPLIIRTFDLGGDKLAPGATDVGDELNPFLGWRAIRFCLENIDIFKTQLRAILRASAVGNVKIMFPMISGLEELRHAKAVLDECRNEVGEKKSGKMEVGAMIEIPSAAISADSLAREVDFFSIGTNDLIQYTIAVDRVNERIAHLYEPTHPAVLRLLKMIADAAHANKIWVGVCGEMARDVALIPILLGLGIDELSVGARSVPRVKMAVRSLAVPECQQLVNEVLGLQTSSEILARCLELATKRYGDLLG